MTLTPSFQADLTTDKPSLPDSRPERPTHKLAQATRTTQSKANQGFEIRIPKEESFRQFMRRALYDVERGYYTARINTVGARGDFSTSATLSPVLGASIANWLRAEAKAMPGVRTIIEVGGGGGSLMEGVLKSLGWWARWRFKVVMVETSPVLKAQQKARLKGKGVTWYSTLREALGACLGEALIFHNELFDAFPVSLVQWDAAGGKWDELWLKHETDGRVVEQLRPLLLPSAEHSALNEWGQKTPQGQRCELHEDARAWLHEWIPAWRRGAMLSIDYGDLFPAIYARRPAGTLRGYVLQQRLEGRMVYENVGRQDLTVDVNFSDVRRWLIAMGCHEMSYQTQAEFIAQWKGAKHCVTEADRFVTNAGGAGNAFKCLAVRCLERRT